MFSHLERPHFPPPSLRQIIADLDFAYVAHGFIGWLFAATAPVAIILAVGSKGGLSEAELASWVFAVFFVNGVITIFFSWLYRQPMAFFWTIPGTVLVGPALQHLTFPQVLGAFYATGLITVALGATDWVGRAMKLIPMPVVMGMVAGVFLRFGLDLIRALHSDVAIAGPMALAWLGLSASPRLSRALPPILGALMVGAMAILLLGRLDPSSLGPLQLAHPIIQTPQLSWAAMVELTVPLAITVLVVQNGQGYAVLRNAGHEPPVDSTTVACGVGSLLSALAGGVSTCLAGPTNAILVSSGIAKRQYTAGIAVGVFSVVFGLMAPSFTRLMLNAPKAFVMTLAGLAMLRVLQSAFIGAFRERFALGGLVAFLVTTADLGLFNIGAAFWGLVAGFFVSRLLEPEDFRATT
ncbi:benzoate/H(+) symporter BenE family transporter [Rhodoblastus sp. 17X3]|nr:benzoate/H(+) symporter BenE family transporter [Rhodoblastus sp. 17X3]MDI9848860.1 benzoate/H(+) symporter BenE family transporter [Rhodoblastus sp. 17X3]